MNLRKNTASMNDDSLNCSSAPECIPVEILSRYFDGEDVLSAKDRSHLKHCRICTGILDDFVRLDQTLKNVAMQQMDHDFDARMLNSVKRKIAAEEIRASRSSHFAWGLRIAALLALGTGFAFLMHREITDSSNHAMSGAGRNGVGSVTTLAPGEYRNPVMSAAPMHSRDTLEKTSFGTIDLDQIVPANIQFRAEHPEATPLPRERFAGQPILPRKTELPAQIHADVTHTWVTPASLQSIRSFLENLRKTPGLHFVTGDVVCKDKIASVTLTLNRREAVLLTRALQQAGLKLLSSRQPQPEQTIFIGTGNEPVNYTALFVSDRK